MEEAIWFVEIWQQALLVWRLKHKLGDIFRLNVLGGKMIVISSAEVGGEFIQKSTLFKCILRPRMNYLTSEARNTLEGLICL
jgi:hypothetical protein